MIGLGLILLFGRSGLMNQLFEPSVLLFDEPLSNLDASLRRQVRDEIRDLQRRLGITVVYGTHDQEEALAVSDRIIVMLDGRIAQDGSPRELYERPADAFVAGFMGEANRVKGVLERLDDTVGCVDIGGLRRTMPHGGLPAGPVEVAIRPETLAIGRGPAAAGASLGGTVTHAAYLGSHMEYSIATEIGRLFVTCPGTEQPLAPGSAVALTLADRGVTLLRPRVQ